MNLSANETTPYHRGIAADRFTHHPIEKTRVPISPQLRARRDLLLHSNHPPQASHPHLRCRAACVADLFPKRPSPTPVSDRGDRAVARSPALCVDPAPRQLRLLDTLAIDQERVHTHLVTPRRHSSLAAELRREKPASGNAGSTSTRAETRDDFKHCLDYLHVNPLKHHLVQRVRDWPWSSFHRYVKLGEYTPEWGSADIWYGDEWNKYE